jgi:pilus assembly protein Flp/PilA
VLLRFPRTSKGQGLVEYALILVLVALVVLVVLVIFGPAVGNTYSNIVAGV